MTRSEFLPFSRPTIGEEEIVEVVDCLRSGWITSGPRVARFEAAFSERMGGREAIAVCSATAGLHLLLHALGIGPGDEVIVPSLTWASTANAVELLGARAVLADVDPDTLQLDPGEVARLVGERTKAVIPVHFAGAPCDLDAIRAALSGHDIAIVEDAAHALGARLAGREIGSFGAAAVFSFHPTKNMTTAEGGMIVCADPTLAARLRRLRSHGISRDAWNRYATTISPRYDVIEPGYKYNLTDLHAALGLVQLGRLDNFNAERRALAERYDVLLEMVPSIAPIARPAYAHDHAWHLYVIRMAGGGGLDRDGLIAALARANIGTGLHFPALHTQVYYRDRPGGSDPLPHASQAAEEILSLPLYPGLTGQDQADVVAALADILQAAPA